ncbi:hypothetical protein F6Y05_04140 [Bacillus megaterium]|nr:hypothetical protein [Priestia megaterium]
MEDKLYFVGVQKDITEKSKTRKSHYRLS